MNDKGVDLSRLAHYDFLDERGRLLELPCGIGDEIFVICKCEYIPTQLDGSLYGPDGGPGTATGYYCPYEDNCPHDADSCEDCKDEEAVFEDSVCMFLISEDGIKIVSKNCDVCCGLGEGIFLTREEAENYLKGEQENNGERI